MKEKVGYLRDNSPSALLAPNCDSEVHCSGPRGYYVNFVLKNPVLRTSVLRI
jgi:hypothetical protein